MSQIKFQQMILGNTEYLALALTYEGDRRAGELRAGEGGKRGNLYEGGRREQK